MKSSRRDGVDGIIENGGVINFFVAAPAPDPLGETAVLSDGGGGSAGIIEDDVDDVGEGTPP